MALRELPTWLAGAREEGPQAVSVVGGKGGISKSLTALLTAYQLGQIAPTLLINADKKQTDGGVTEMVESLAVPAPFELTESDDPTELSSIRRLKQFRYVVTDNAPHRDATKFKIACEADLVIAPLTPRRLDAKAVMHTIRTVLVPSQSNFRVLISCVPHPGKSKAQTMQETLNTLGIPVFKTIMRQYGVHEMVDGHLAFTSERPNAGKAARDAQGLGNEVLAALGEPYTVLGQGVEKEEREA